MMDNVGQKRGTLDADPSAADGFDVSFRDLVERANDIFVIVDGHGVIQFVNQTYSRLTGIARQEIEGEKLAALFAPDERQNAQSRLTWALQSGGQSAVGLPLRARGGDPIELSFRPSAERTPEGALARIVLVGQSPFLYGDLAEQFNGMHRDLKNYSTQLEQMNVELEHRIQERTARLTALFEISASLNAELHLDALFEQILRQAIETIPGAEAGALLLYDAELDRLLVQAATGYENQNLIHDLQIEMERIQPQAVFADRKVRIWGGEARAKSGQMRLLLRHVDQFRIRSAISAPIATPTERLGVLLLHNFDEPSAFTEDDVALAASLASSAAIAITNARLYDETSQQAERLEFVNRLSASVRDSVDLDQTLNLAVEGLHLVLSVSRAAITLFDETADRATYSAQFSEPGVKALTDLPSLLLGTPLLREVLGFRVSRTVVDARQDPRIDDIRRRIAELGVESLVVVPLVVRDRFIGTVELHQCDRRRHWKDSEVSLVESVARQVATAVHQVRLHSKLRETVRESQALFRAASILIDTSDLGSLLDQILTAIDDEFEGLRSAIVLVDHSGESLTVRSTHGHSPELNGARLALDGPGAIAHVARTRKPLILGDAAGSSAYGDRWTTCVSELAVPLILEGDVIGVLDLQSSLPGAFSERDLRILAPFAERAAFAISKARLFEQVSLGKREWEGTFDSMSDAVYILGPDRRLIRANSAAWELEGRSFADLAGLRCCELLAADDERDVECLVERAMAVPERVTREMVRRGRELSITVDPMLSADGSPRGAVVVVHDLTPQRRAERESQQQREVLAHVVENAYDVIALIDAGGRIVWYNRALRDVTGYDEARLHGAEFGGLLAESARADMQRCFELAIAGDPQIVETILIDASHSERDLVLTAAPVNEDGRVTGVLVIGRDVTDEKRSAEKAAEADKLRALGQLASGVAHDFNNVLAAILGRAQLLKRKLEGVETHRALDVIETAALDGAATVKRIQTFAHQRADSELVPVDVKAIAADAVEITRTRWRNEAQSHGVQYDIRLASTEEGVAVLGDASELREVFVNLLINALDAMPGGGAIEIEVTSAGDYAKVRFVDSGTGMSDDVRRRAFEP
ncbi:MAG: GAF domain-containing protein, partial [Acidobacteria bacterium]|nr:GAF domain-containing protein [Acidobacteriota bacterium]